MIDFGQKAYCPAFDAWAELTGALGGVWVLFVCWTCVMLLLVLVWSGRNRNSLPPTLSPTLHLSYICRYGEPEYAGENAVVDGDMEGSMDGLKKPKKHHKKDKPPSTTTSRAVEAAELRAAQRQAAGAKLQVA